MWDDSVVLAGVPGEFAAIARRRGDDWWIGVVGNTEPQTLDIPTDRLPAMTQYEATIHEDVGGAVARRSISLTSGTPISLTLAASGGAALRLRLVAG